MSDIVVPVVKEVMDGKLISIGISVIVTTVGACYSVYVWLFKRQVKRIDHLDLSFVAHKSDLDSLDKTQALLTMQLALVQDSSDKIDSKHTLAIASQEARHTENLAALELRHKEDLNSVREETIRIIDTMDKNNNNRMEMLQNALNQLVAQGDRTRHSDQ